MKFRCKHSGNVFDFKEAHDIASMLKHPDYEEVREVHKEKIEIPEFAVKKPAKKSKGE